MSETIQKSVSDQVRLSTAVATARPWMSLAPVWSRIERRVLYGVVGEWLVILMLAVLYGGANLLNMDPMLLQQTGEHNESATLPLLAEIGLRRYGEIPLWNPYMLTGFPHQGDFINHFWNPVSTLSVLAFGGVNGMKVSIFLSLVIAGWGQWILGHVLGLRGAVRLWAAVLFMTSGGLALLWRLGWYELLLGMAWFPWAYAALWWAMKRRDAASLALAAVPVAMILTTGGGYYPFYLSFSAAIVVLVGVALAMPRDRTRVFWRAVLVGALGVGLSAVLLLPFIDGYRYTGRDAAAEQQQSGSQPIVYAVINYVVSQPQWFNTEILGNKGGWNWFYIGSLPLLALALVPLAWRRRQYRSAVILSGALVVFILAWHANRHSPMRFVYDAVPLLYWLRFPGRLLILATCPLLILAGLGLQHASDVFERWGRPYRLTLGISGRGQVSSPSLSLAPITTLLVAVVLLLSARDVYATNKGFGFAPGRIDPQSYTALRWLKTHDPSLYYTNIGGGAVIWGWTLAAYDLEMPIINFQYNRRLASWDAQRRQGAPIVAQPKYIIAAPNQPRPANAQQLREFVGLGLWQVPDALPFAFTAPASLLASGTPVTVQSVRPLEARYDGPNRVVVSGEVPSDHRLVVLVSDYPGWSVSADGAPAVLEAINGYLGARPAGGAQTYTFEFRPAQHTVGLTITMVTLGIVIAMLVVDVRRRGTRPVLAARDDDPAPA